MKTGFSLCSISHREKPVFITWEHCNENRFFPVWEKYTGKPCSGPVLALYGIAVYTDDCRTTAVNCLMINSKLENDLLFLLEN